MVIYLDSESNQLIKVEEKKVDLLVKPKVIPENNIYNNFQDWLEYIRACNRIQNIQDGEEDKEVLDFLMNENIIKSM